MEDPLPVAAEVFDNLPHLLHNPDLVQLLLDRAFADLERNRALALQAADVLRELLPLEARILQARMEPDGGLHAAVVAMIEAARDTAKFHRRQQRMLIQIIGLLIVFRARSRARLLPGVFLAAVSAAVVVYVSTGGGVVPGFRSFVRFVILLLGFLFASNRPPRGA